MIPRALNAPLSWIGLMRVSEHEREIEVLEDLLAEADAGGAISEAKFKKAVTDLAAQAAEIEAYKEDAKALHRGLDEYMAEIKNLTNMLQSEIANSRLVEADNAELKTTFNQRLADAVQDYQADALLWRAARQKRADRKVK